VYNDPYGSLYLVQKDPKRLCIFIIIPLKPLSCLLYLFIYLSLLFDKQIFRKCIFSSFWFQNNDCMLYVKPSILSFTWLQVNKHTAQVVCYESSGMCAVKKLEDVDPEHQGGEFQIFARFRNPRSNWPSVILIYSRSKVVFVGQCSPARSYILFYSPPLHIPSSSPSGIPILSFICTPLGVSAPFVHLKRDMRTASAAESFVFHVYKSPM